MLKSFKVTTPFGTETCTMSASNYGKKGHIALQLWCEDGPFATITVNLPGLRGMKQNVSAVDVNNCPWAPALIKRLGIGKDTGHYLCSGFCVYPVYEFDMDRIAYYTGKSCGNSVGMV